LALALAATASSIAVAQPSEDTLTEESYEAQIYGEPAGAFASPSACKKATKAQIAEINKGNAKKADFLAKCAAETGNSPWCDQLVRPNPDSAGIFECTYGKNQPHQLVHPDADTWKNAIEAVKIVQELTNSGISVCLIYNWWRPEPYNKNVGGSAIRHPYGTAVDVRFCTLRDKDLAHAVLCQMRKEGRVNAVGYYPTAALHFGVGDTLQNTWGKACP
jgi:hypothetical protein